MTQRRDIPGVRSAGDSSGDGEYSIQSSEQRLLQMIQDFNDPSQ